ncbi:hypothetical protein N9N67_07680 [Bacteriovoracaceae bacterium]|nr:hypothetical protein [Bacteriovoracaceae bacterium]
MKRIQQWNYYPAFFVWVFILAHTSSLQAKIFQSEYCEFKLPTGWECALEGGEWVCQSSNEDRKKEAIIILAAKIRGKSDSMEDYKRYLNEPKTYTLPGGMTQRSEMKYTKVADLRDHKWIDSLHLASEVPGFYTRYLATVKEDIGVAVTFSVSRKHYNEYKNLMDELAATLKVFRKRKAVIATGSGAAGDNSGVGGSVFDPMDNDAKFNIAKNKGKNGSGSGTGVGDDAWLLILGAAVVGVILLKKLKK